MCCSSRFVRQTSFLHWPSLTDYIMLTCLWRMHSIIWFLFESVPKVEEVRKRRKKGKEKEGLNLWLSLHDIMEIFSKMYQEGPTVDVSSGDLRSASQWEQTLYPGKRCITSLLGKLSYWEFLIVWVTDKLQCDK